MKSNNSSNQNKLEITLLKDGSEFTLIIQNPLIFEFFENDFNSQYISHVKCLLDNNNYIWISFDPYDELINDIEERDNFNIKFSEFEIKS
ncbi:hypothetical protein OO013_16670 [Mangrovivirga sp. M17]|uniref:Uncharacterized protein n=1 Tax=Mangrovivirga halotolerans TaxID=2993936 RepID=A0ABT3RV23_9BACT|nr:hypothetical protein [Mangrovivirga halotolerans]MCX2745516.1 hypothetical protein [Mangrovivirga halotolerans]